MFFGHFSLRILKFFVLFLIKYQTKFIEKCLSIHSVYLMISQEWYIFFEQLFSLLSKRQRL